MKTKNIIILGALSVASVVGMMGCSDFAEVNTNPNDANIDQVQPEWFLNNSILGAQMNPEIAERIFVLMWKRSAHFDRGSGFTLGADNDEYNRLYLVDGSYALGWLNRANSAIDIAKLKIEKDVDNLYPHYRNIPSMARIWRAYLNSELADNFGPIPVLNAFQGVVTEYNSEKIVYEYILKELKEAEAGLDESIDMSAMSKYDPFFAGDVSKWKKYANSMRMRIAMRISAVDPELAKAEFEDAVKKPFIQTAADIAGVQEVDTNYDDLSGVMSRSWNKQPISVTFNNLVVGLGGQEFGVPEELQSYVKDPHQYLGEYLDKQFPLTTNDPCAGYYFQGIPKYIDPRAPKLYNIPGYDDGSVYSTAIGMPEKDVISMPNVKDSKDNVVEIRVKYSWSAWVAGLWDQKGSLADALITPVPHYPSLAKSYRNGSLKRIFFGNWESYFLLAEAGVNGWTVPGTTKDNYEKGIAASFDYHGVSARLAGYLESTDYNRIGTSVKFDHTEEAKPYTITYHDPYTNTDKTTTYTYPKNSIYKNGQVNNDQLTKIITQKYIAQNPWLPLEVWNDQRRLGLPFFENQATEVAYNPTNQVLLTPATSKECRLDFYPKRLRYPAAIQTNNPEGYNKAIQELGGENKTTTPLWWNKK